MIAPVVIFVYNRQDHIQKVLNALMLNTLVRDTELYIFSDAAKSINSQREVQAVRDFIKSDTIKKTFLKVTIIESHINKGLARSIIEGVTYVLQKHGRVIVLEDDSVPAPDYLEFMNRCLEYYQENAKIWSIGAYGFISDFPKDYNHDIYLMGRTCSYAWATWEDRWNRVDWNINDYVDFKWNLKKRRDFNKYGTDRALMLDAQQCGLLNSWAIRFCYAMFKNNMFTVYPRYSRIINIGQDGTGTNYKKNVQPPSFLIDEHILTPKSMVLSQPSLDERLRNDFISIFKLSPVQIAVKKLRIYRHKLLCRLKQFRD